MTHRVQDRYSRAVVSTNLRHHEHVEVEDDVSVLIAAAWAHGTSLAGMLFRLRIMADRKAPQTERTTEAAFTALLNFVATTASRHHDTAELDGVALERITAQLLVVVLRPKCPACHGVAYAVIAGTGRLGDVACPRCLGTGRRALLLGGAELDLARTVADQLTRKLDAMSGRMARALR